MAEVLFLLVRHGQYIPENSKKKIKEKLTPLGRKQAQLIGRRLQQYKITEFHQSTMPRAVETASIIQRKIKFKKKIVSDDLLRECVPDFPKKLRKKYKFNDAQKLKKDLQQAKAAFKKYFVKSRKEKVILIVAHGNIIRFFICAMLGIDTIKWRQLDIKQCSLSQIRLKTKGPNRQVVVSHNDCGHIPLKLQTFL